MEEKSLEVISHQEEMNQQKILKKSIRKVKITKKTTKPETRARNKVLLGSSSNFKTSFKFLAKYKNKDKRDGNMVEEKMIIEDIPIRTPDDYHKIKDVPVYEPTTQEFRDPMALINKLYSLGFDKFGCVKIKPPTSWKPTFQFNYVDKRLTTRKQTIQDLGKGKCFEQNVEAYSLKEFELLATKFEIEHSQKNIISNIKNPFRSNEFEFWSMVENPLFCKEVTVEYAADLPSKKYGSAFPMAHPQFKDANNVDDERFHYFNLNNINHTRDSLFKIPSDRKCSISGITSPWVYLGMLFASFCWHVEDNFMYSINYMHRGAAKTWYCVPGDYKKQFEAIIRSKYPHVFDKKPHILHNIILMMNPLELLKHNIPVYRTEQYANEFIVTFPKAYHCGFSHGFNVGEAVNIAPVDWLNFGKEAIEEYAIAGFFKKASFPHEWIVLDNVRNIELGEFSTLARDQLYDHYDKLKNKELADRQNVQKCYSKLTTIKFPNDEIKYDSHICSTCKNYTFLSYLECNHCHHKACTSHVTICDCLNPSITLHIRYTNQELIEYAIRDKKKSKKKI